MIRVIMKLSEGCAQIWHLPYSWGKLQKTSARRPSDEGAVWPFIASNGVPLLQMRSVGSHSTSGRVAFSVHLSRIVHFCECSLHFEFCCCQIDLSGGDRRDFFFIICDLLFPEFHSANNHFENSCLIPFISFLLHLISPSCCSLLETIDLLSPTGIWITWLFKAFQRDFVNGAGICEGWGHITANWDGNYWTSFWQFIV